jgi:hypothetical protein
MKPRKLKKINIDAAVFVYILAAITVVICPGILVRSSKSGFKINGL